MASMLSVEILSPTRPLAALQAKHVNVPGAFGYIGIKPGHASLTSTLETGVLTLELEDSSEGVHYFVSSGYMEILHDQVKILVDSAEAVDEVDHERAASAEKRALDRLEETSNMDLNIPRALASLKRARARLALNVRK